MSRDGYFNQTIRANRFRLMARNIAKTIPSGEFTRASGDIVCEKCGLLLYDHPVCADGLLHVGCDGRLWKL